MGPSGSGKSTLMHLLAGLDSPTSGEVWLGGSRLAGLDDTELTRLRRKRVGFVFQSFNLLPVLSAQENIVMPLRIAGAEIDRDWLERLLINVGLQDRRHHRPSELSGGQQQRVALARALMTKPAVIFADEPTGNLDSVSGEVILRMLRRAVDELGQTIVIVTHDPRGFPRPVHQRLREGRRDRLGPPGHDLAPQRPASMPVSLVRRIRALPGVAEAQGQISDIATIVGRNGKVISSSASPSLAISNLTAPFGGLRFVQGGRPAGPHEVALDQATAAPQGYHVGDLVPIVTGQPVQRFRISGLVRLGGASLGGATFAVFSLPTARALFDKPRKVDLIYVAAARGTTPAALVRQIRPLLPTSSLFAAPRPRSTPTFSA
jgi:ABC-type lipoprotein export system ATPase subunit